MSWAESRRDQEGAGLSRRVGQSCAGPGGQDLEEGGGAWPSRVPRRDLEQGGGAGLQLFLNSRSTDIVFVTLLRTAVETAISGVH